MILVVLNQSQSAGVNAKFTPKSRLKVQTIPTDNLKNVGVSMLGFTIDSLLNCKMLTYVEYIFHRSNYSDMNTRIRQSLVH